MKKFVTLIFLALSLYAYSLEKPLIESPKVDIKIELISIVFRLTDNIEYNSTNFKVYTDRIEHHFAHYKDHELIQFAWKIRKEKGISYDAPMSLAIFLDDNLNPLKEISENSLDRWSKDDANEFIKLLKMFYKDTEFVNSTHNYQVTKRKKIKKPIKNNIWK